MASIQASSALGQIQESSRMTLNVSLLTVSGTVRHGGSRT